ncbi:MAG: TRAP transporter substrate-binding protein DctP [Rhodobacteraceae bacterium]|nr:TRAP transporter substrate-binding protein DctP [Paracoccaceae bacterium]
MNKVLALATAAGLSFGLAGTAVAQEVRLNAVSFVPRVADIAQGFGIFVERINEEFAGELHITWRGGPEVIPAFEQGNAVRQGAIDMAFVSPSFYEGLLPSSSAPNLSIKSFVEIRDSGYFERMAELHREVGLELIGEVPATDVQFYLFLRDPIESVADFDGKRIRVFPTVLPFVRALGAEPIVMPQEDIFTAMERGLVDGFARGSIGWAEQFEGVVNYYVAPSFYRAGFSILANPRSWGRLSPDLQERVTAFIMNELAPEIDESWAGLIAEGDAQMERAGFTRIELEGADAEAYLATALNAAWEVLAGKAPDVADELRAFLVD